jgi:LAO/AO transport system kinase
VAVLAVDPSSTISHGSILGDKTRMEELVKDKMPLSVHQLQKHWVVWRENQRINQPCEACGFDTNYN